jgi:hypothetical protein
MDILLANLQCNLPFVARVSIRRSFGCSSSPPTHISLLLYSESEVFSLLVAGVSSMSIGSAADVDGKSCGGRVDNGVKGADGRLFGGRPRFLVSVVGV